MKFSTVWDMEYWMNSQDLFCGFNTPKALKSKECDEDNNKEEFKFGLPPYAKVKSFLTDEYPACPVDWMRSEGKLTSYFVPVKEGQGMWLDFNKNWTKEHDLAIVVSVQGINPITGLPCVDPHLEQYLEECPKCKEKFSANRFCKTCGYKWPKQNYICTTGTPNGMLWLDGFRTADGVVRQYILTQEKMRGVASNIIGESRVYAIGISFFLSKEKKEIKLNSYNYYSHSILNSPNIYQQPQFFSPLNTPINWTNRVSNYYDECSAPSSNYKSLNLKRSKGKTKGSVSISGINSINYQLSQTANDSDLVINTNHAFDIGVECVSSSDPIETQKVEVGAGANINQIVHDDPESIDFWREKPDSILCINYCLEEDCEKIIKAGRVQLKSHKEGFLKNVNVGN